MLPAAPDTGIVFRRTDAGAEIRASWINTAECRAAPCCRTAKGSSVGTVEHLMAALAGAEIDNAIVEVDGPEVPIMDGSAAPFLFLIECAGIVEQDAPRRAIKVLKPVSVSEPMAPSAALSPDHGFSMSFEIDFDNPLIRRQDMSVVVDPETFKAELSRARTFGLLDEVARLRAAGLARGGSLDNAVVVSGDRVLNDGGLRYADEFVRHKMLDAFGDLYLGRRPDHRPFPRGALGPRSYKAAAGGAVCRLRGLELYDVRLRHPGLGRSMTGTKDSAPARDARNRFAGLAHLARSMT